MRKKYYTLILALFFCSVFGQLKLEFKLLNSIADITIYNTSKENYILPIDRFHLRPYETDCSTFANYESEFPSFGLMVNIFTSDGKRENYVMGYKHFDNFDSIGKKVNFKRDSFRKKILKWGEKNKIKDYNEALINYNLINNLIYLKPNEKISFKIKFDLYNITNQELIFYNYILEKSLEYKISLSMCEFNGIDKYFTVAQKKKLKKYKLFSGEILSNKVELIQ
ncbi:hypothetical protein PFY12_00640 [Chryseobacterium camelliae]|uniref:Uncharacterized protein n=1 Tax=Chryseobacterium camelliae TaxID=1265445 RepID=A0ABY7QMS4_9FLAO|nr:hypothetical protein [Chryseobacterium camelliae]WBV60639.1 hypothetical protein PFY12_00640 [Chryseobacterium camelliae]